MPPQPQPQPQRRIDRTETYTSLRQTASPFGLVVISRAEALNVPLRHFRRRIGHNYEKFYALLRPMKFLRADYLPDILKIARSFDMDAVELIQLFYGLEDKDMAALMGLFAVYLQLGTEEEKQVFFRLGLVFSVHDGEEKKSPEGIVREKLAAIKL